MASERVTLRKGQVWEETDPRSYGRRFALVAITNTLVEVRNLHNGRRSFIQRRRLRPTNGKRGYRLVKDMTLP